MLTKKEKIEFLQRLKPKSLIYCYFCQLFWRKNLSNNKIPDYYWQICQLESKLWSFQTSVYKSSKKRFWENPFFLNSRYPQSMKKSCSLWWLITIQSEFAFKILGTYFSIVLLKIYEIYEIMNLWKNLWIEKNRFWNHLTLFSNIYVYLLVYSCLQLRFSKRCGVTNRTSNLYKSHRLVT